MNRKLRKAIDILLDLLTLGVITLILLALIIELLVMAARALHT